MRFSKQERAHQTPAFGNLPASEGGDFIFQFNHETEPAQLGDEGIKANAELEKLREEIRKEAAQNAELKKQLAAAEAKLKQDEQADKAALGRMCR